MPLTYQLAIADGKLLFKGSNLGMTEAG